MFFDYPIIDLHSHLRNEITKHTEIAKKYGIDVVVYMANCNPSLDTPETIQNSLKIARHCKAFPVSAITKGLRGEELVDVNNIKSLVVGFSDDGEYLENLNLLKEVLKKDVLVMAHCSPSYEIGVRNPELETKFIKRYLEIFEKTGGKLHIQHISKKKSVDLIRKAKKQGMGITCETCPHYFSFTKQDLNVIVNPPLGTEEDIAAIKEGLYDETIDVLVSDYAPEPRKTGIAGFRSFIPLSYGLVIEKVLSEEQLKEKLFLNPKKIIEKGSYADLNL